jgi:hypothetical protein
VAQIQQIQNLKKYFNLSSFLFINYRLFSMSG